LTENVKDNWQGGTKHRKKRRVNVRVKSRNKGGCWIQTSPQVRSGCLAMPERRWKLEELGIRLRGGQGRQGKRGRTPSCAGSRNDLYLMMGPEWASASNAPPRHSPSA